MSGINIVNLIGWLLHKRIGLASSQATYHGPLCSDPVLAAGENGTAYGLLSLTLVHTHLFHQMLHDRTCS